MPAIRELMTSPQVWRYVAVGVAGYLLEVAILVLLPRFGASAGMSVTVSYWVGLAASFAAQKLLAFSNFDTGPLLARQVFAYGCLVLVNYGFTLGCVHLAAGRIPLVAVRTVCLGMTTVWNYAVYATVIFRRTPGGSRPRGR
ncbi:MAG: GtrA family protein [Bifidobacteriaceae bacterium]|jgi:putative flippase GtrA|nr:GtrA family protein [Bifidobacteriaceae bacterium]